MVVAVPPEPVAAFGDEHLLASLGHRDLIDGPARRGVQYGSGVSQLAPPFLVVDMADPDVEVRVDPGTGKDAGQLTDRRGAALGHRDRPQLRVSLEPAI